MKEKETMYYVLIDVRTMDLTAPYVKNDRDLHRGRRDGLTKGIIGNVLDAIIATWEETNGKTHK